MACMCIVPSRSAKRGHDMHAVVYKGILYQKLTLPGQYSSCPEHRAVQYNTTRIQLIVIDPCLANSRREGREVV